jgi:hypothetical protein
MLVGECAYVEVLVAHIVRRAVRVIILGLVAVMAVAGSAAQAGAEVRGPLPAPVLTSPADGTLFTDLAPETTLTWQPVYGAKRYTVELQCFCTTDWAAWMTTTVRTTSFTFAWNRGTDFKERRWRVTPVAANGTPGTASAWWAFRYEPRPSPVLLSPPDGTVFTTLPRTTTVTWQLVDWAVALNISIECFGCSIPGQWTSWFSTLLTWNTTSFTFDWPGPFRGRWHVSGKPPGPPGPPPSPWWEFEYTV